MKQWSWKVWGAILGGLIVVIAAWLGVISALIVIVGALVGFFIGAIIDGDIGFHIGKGNRVR
jgi:Small integral membrane protein (DUF2273)